MLATCFSLRERPLRSIGEVIQAILEDPEADAFNQIGLFPRLRIRPEAGHPVQAEGRLCTGLNK